MRVFFRIAIVLLLTVSARADSFNYTFYSSNSTLSGTLHGYLLSPGVYQIDGMTGAIVPGQDPPLNEIVALLPPGEFNNADNLLFTSEPYVDSFGLNFLLGNGLTYALAYDEIGYLRLTCILGCTEMIRIRGDLEVSSTISEPPSLLLMASGFTLLAGHSRRIGVGRFANRKGSRVARMPTSQNRDVAHPIFAE